jgi:O-antigen ligase
VLALVLPLALHYAVHARAPRRLYQWAQLALVGLGALVSVSRGATLGIAVALVTVFVAWPRALKRRALLLSPLIALALPSIAPGVLGTLRGLFTNVSNDPSVTGRTDDYALIMPFVRDHPVLGRGFGAFIPQLYPLPGGRSGGSLILDNEYLSTLVQKGIVGVVVLLALFLGAFMVARAARRAGADPVTRDLAQALAAAILVPAVTFAGFDGLSFPMIAGLTFLTVGVIGALWRVTRSQVHQVTPSALRAATSAVRGLPSPSRP